MNLHKYGLARRRLLAGVALALGGSQVHAQDEVVSFPSIEDGALVPFKGTDQSIRKIYVAQDKINEVLAPAVTLFCEPYALNGKGCELIAKEREKITASDGVSSLTSLKATVRITHSDGQTEDKISSLNVELLRSCPSGAVLTTTSLHQVANLSRLTAFNPTACRRFGLLPTAKALGLPRTSSSNICPISTTPLVGNPINPTTLSKIEIVADIRAPHGSALGFVRIYQSGAYPANVVYPDTAVIYPQTERMGSRWRHNFDRRLVSRRHYSSESQSYVDGIALIDEDGKETTFIVRDDGYASESDERGRLSTDGKGWAYARPDGVIERFDVKGYLSSKTDGNGRSLNLTYRDGSTDGSQELVRVTDWKGRSITLDYDSSGRVSAVTGPDGGHVAYEYDETLTAGPEANLSKVTYADGTSIQYLYDEPEMGGFPAHKLTGIIKEDGKRFATFRYDHRNRAESSEHGGGLEKNTAILSSDGLVRHRTLSGREESFELSAIYGIPRIRKRSESLVGPGKIERSYSFLGDGRVDSFTDYLGIATTLSYDPDRGLESERTEAAGTPGARTTRTKWHPIFDLPVSIEVGSASVSYLYDDRGNLVEKRRTVSSGHLPDARVDRVTRYAYDAHGLLTSVDGPVEGAGDTSILGYRNGDAPGCKRSIGLCDWRKNDVHTLTDPSGLTETILRYDGAGRVRSSADVNGVITDHSYDARGRRLSTTIRARPDGAPSEADIVTTFAYTASGELARQIDGDKVSISFEYDDAHRMVAEVDNLNRRHEFSLNGDGLAAGQIYRGATGKVEYEVTRNFNANGSLLRERSPAGVDISFKYDANSSLIEKHHGAEQEVRTLDPRRRPSDILYSLFSVKAKISLAYGELDDVKSVRDPKALLTSYTRNGAGDLLGISSPDTGGARQGTCRLSYAACNCFPIPLACASTTASRSGFKVTEPTGDQSRVA
ncbi:MAG TPA: DUF6531 domain-containing protein, partial [Luteibacter sp.]